MVTAIPQTHGLKKQIHRANYYLLKKAKWVCKPNSVTRSRVIERRPFN